MEAFVLRLVTPAVSGPSAYDRVCVLLALLSVKKLCQK